MQRDDDSRHNKCTTNNMIKAEEMVWKGQESPDVNHKNVEGSEIGNSFKEPANNPKLNLFHKEEWAKFPPAQCVAQINSC